jgi:hypothetical protein
MMWRTVAAVINSDTLLLGTYVPDVAFVVLSCLGSLYNMCSLQVLCFMKAGVAVHW